MDKTPNENDLKYFTKEFLKNDVIYNFEFKKLKNVLHFKVSKPLDLNYWENTVEYQELQKKNTSLFMHETDFIEIIYYGMMLSEFDFTFEEENLSLIFSIEMALGKYKNKLLIPILLTNKKGEISDNLSNIATHVKKMDNSYEKLKNSVEVKLNDLEHNISEKIKTVFHNEGLKTATKIFPKFVNLNNGNYTITNDNKTIEKIGSGWYGVRADELPVQLGIYVCSIKVDKTDDNSHIMFGVCLKIHSNSSGYYNGQCLAMLYLHNGYIYVPSIANSAANGFRAISGAVITMKIDTIMKYVTFKVNGENIAPPRFFNCRDEDLSKICPCVDLHTAGDKVSFC
jgi:hypothetical protein